MRIFKLIGRIWEFISRLARVAVALDDFLLEAKAFCDWLKGDEPVEPDKK